MVNLLVMKQDSSDYVLVPRRRAVILLLVVLVGLRVVQFKMWRPGRCAGYREQQELLARRQII